VGVLLNTGNGTFPATATTYSTNGTGPRGVAAADLVSGGKPDLIVANYTSSNVGVLLNTGNGTFPATATVYGTGGTNPRGIAVGDLNGDGKPDVVVTNNTSDTVGVLLGNGDGTLAAATTFNTASGYGPFGVAVADLNGDGKPDVVITSSSDTTGTSTDTVGVLLNANAPPPVTLNAVGGLPFDVAVGAFGAGEFVEGDENAFNGYGRLMIAGTLFQPGSLTYTTANSGQSIITANGTSAGLTVSREVTVPDTGSQSFARTLDTFTNSTGSPITTTVEVVGALGSDAATTVFATSDGTGVVSPNDEWIGTDGNGTPAIVTCIHGPLGLRPNSVAVTGCNISWSYSLTVPAGQTVDLAYLTVVAPTQTAAVAAANALVTPGGFGGQAAAYLSQSQLSSLLNFVFAQPPMVSAGNAGAVTFVRGGRAVAVAPNLTVTDPDSTTLASAKVAISGGELDSGDEILAATTAGTKITASYNGAGTLTLTGTDTLADYQQVLRSVTYVDTLSTTTNLGNRTLNITVNDGFLNSATVTATVAFEVLTAVNPTVTNTVGPGTLGSLSASGAASATGSGLPSASAPVTSPAVAGQGSGPSQPMESPASAPAATPALAAPASKSPAASPLLSAPKTPKTLADAALLSLLQDA
jgi:hypothetical protein